MQGYVGCEPAGSSAAWECWGAGVIIRYALITSDGPTGGFVDRNGAKTW
jgi:hypothetical protein